MMSEATAKAMPKIMTRDEVRAHWLSLGYTHVETMAGPQPISQWLGRNGEEHGPTEAELAAIRFELREDESAVDGAGKPIGSEYLYRGIWTPKKLDGPL